MWSANPACTILKVINDDFEGADRDLVGIPSYSSQFDLHAENFGLSLCVVNLPCITLATPAAWNTGLEHLVLSSDVLEVLVV